MLPPPQVSGIVQLLRQFAFRPTPKLFAFTLARFPRPNGVPDGWQVFDVEREFVRQGALERCLPRPACARAAALS